MKSLTEKETKSVSGGAAGYGNVQFTCVCGAKFKTDKLWAQHVKSMGHKSASIFYQQTAGKLSQGKKIGTVTATVNAKKKQVTISYPNGKKDNITVK